jgi:hypothetical protein
MITNDEIAKQMGDIREEDRKQIEYLVMELQAMLAGNSINLDNLQRLENVEREVFMLRRSYTERIMRLLKLGFKIDN